MMSARLRPKATSTSFLPSIADYPGTIHWSCRASRSRPADLRLSKSPRPASYAAVPASAASAVSFANGSIFERNGRPNQAEWIVRAAAAAAHNCCQKWALARVVRERTDVHDDGSGRDDHADHHGWP